MRGGTDCDPIEFWAAIFQSTRPLRGGTGNKYNYQFGN